MAYRNEILSLLSPTSMNLSSGSIAATLVGAAGQLPDAWKFALNTTLLAGSKTEKLRAPTTQTWEDLGVPPFATVDSVQLIGYNTTVAGVSGIALTQTLKIRLVDPAGVSVVASDLVTATLPSVVTLRTPNAVGVAKNVLSTAQNSASQIALELESTMNSALGGLSALSTSVDSVLLRINYTPVVETAPTPIRVSLGDM